VKFVFDECISHRIPNALKALGKDADPFSAHWERGEKDTAWIPFVCAQGWCIVTSDRLKRPQERQALRQHNGRVVVLAIRTLTFWEQVRLVINRWERIEKEARKKPPFILRFTRRGVRPQRVSV